jgi:predicted  nucleic acid-binding Zn-ribbon protein
MYNLIYSFGYRMRLCSRCRKKRLLPVHDGKRSGESGRRGMEPVGSSWLAGASGGAGGSEGQAAGGEVRTPAAGSSDGNMQNCPECGGSKYHRTRRSQLERLRQSPPMARCDNCGKRFPYPGNSEDSWEREKTGKAGDKAGHRAEENNTSRGPQAVSSAHIHRSGTGADSSRDGSACCPACGSTAYRRSHRTTGERLLLRPKMARCQQCRKRFPYPKS